MTTASPLSPTDHTLLTDLLNLDEDFRQLAAETNTPLLDLYSWANQPHIRELLDLHRRHEEYLHQRAARRTLHESLTTAADPIERRRAATTLLRALRPTSSPHSARRSSPSHPTVRTADTPPPTPTPPPATLTEEDIKYLGSLGINESLIREITGTPCATDLAEARRSEVSADPPKPPAPPH